MSIRVGLRFRARDAPRLRELAACVRRGEIPGDTATFEQAEQAALTGEPLEVYCTQPDEAHLMAALYTRLGVTPTSIESLTSAR